MVRRGSLEAEVQGSDAQPDQRVSSTKDLTSTTGNSTKLERMTRRIGRREELLSSASSMSNPQPDKDGTNPPESLDIQELESTTISYIFNVWCDFCSETNVVGNVFFTNSSQVPLCLFLGNCLLDSVNDDLKSGPHLLK